MVKIMKVSGVVLLLTITWTLVSGAPNTTVSDSSRADSVYVSPIRNAIGYYCTGCDTIGTRSTRQSRPLIYYDRSPVANSTSQNTNAVRYVPATPGARSSATTPSPNDWNTGCTDNPCAPTARCREVRGRPVCSCPPGYIGNPLRYCRPNEYDSSNSIDYGGSRSVSRPVLCSPGTCGTNANCRVTNQVQVCSCPDGYRGDPLHQCRRIDPDELCSPSPCGRNTKCEVLAGVPTCTCLPGYYGHPLNGCRRECEQDDECSRSESCHEFHCRSACLQCGKGAQCRHVQNHKAQCECPPGFIGSPYTECRAECNSNQECPRARPLCQNGVCLNPCEKACGTGAECTISGLNAVCSCPANSTGNPYQRCRPFTRDDVCAGNPCGANAVCDLVPDRVRADRAVCTCPPGTTGDPWVQCGECTRAEDCSDQQACINNKCVNACAGIQCGNCAECEPKNHVAACKCLPGYTGDALVSCRPIAQPEARYVTSRPGTQSTTLYVDNMYPGVWYGRNYDNAGRYYVTRNYN